MARVLPTTRARGSDTTSPERTKPAAASLAAGSAASGTDAAVKRALVARFAYEADDAPRSKAATGASRRQQFAQKAAAAKPDDVPAAQVTAPAPAPVKTGDQRRLRAEAALRNGICAGKYTTRQTRADRYDQH